MTGLVVGGPLSVFGIEQDSARRAEQDLLQRVGEVGHRDLLVVASRRQQRRLVGEVREIGTDHPGRCRCEGAEVDVIGQRHRAGVHLEDLHAAGAVRGLYRHAAVEAPGAQQRRVEDLGSVGGAEHDHGLR